MSETEQDTNIDEFRTVDEIAQDMRVSSKKVLGFIANGSLRAINVGASSAPRWRITRGDFMQFVNKRSNRSPKNKVVNIRPIVPEKYRQANPCQSVKGVR